MANQACRQTRLLLENDIPNVEALLLPGDTSDIDSFHLGQHSPRVEVQLQDIPEAVVCDQLRCLCAHDQLCKLDLLRSSGRLLVSVLSFNLIFTIPIAYVLHRYTTQMAEVL